MSVARTSRAPALARCGGQLVPWMGFLIPHSHRECQRRVRRRGLSPARGVLRAVQSHRGCAAPSRQPCGRCRYTHGRSLSVQKIVNLFHNSSEHELTRRKHPSVKDWRAWSILALSAYRGSRSTRKKSTTRREAPFELPWADWDDLRLSGYLHDVFSTLVVPDYDKRGPQPPEPILGDF